MARRVQITIDCAEPDRLARFWIEALHYVPEPPPEGFDSWDAYWRHVGLPEEDLDLGIDRITDPDGLGPTIWFQVVPEGKTLKNRLHLDISVSGGRAVPLAQRRERVDAEAARLEAAGATRVRVHAPEDHDHYGITMQDPEGNEFCLN